MANKLYDSNGRLIGKIVHISVEMGAPTKVTLDTGHTLLFNADEIACDDKYNYRIRRHGAYQNYKKGTAALHAASIKNVIFNPPATVVYWSDGTKTVVKCSVNDKFDPERDWLWPSLSGVPITAALITRKFRSGSVRSPAIKQTLQICPKKRQPFLPTMRC